MNPFADEEARFAQALHKVSEAAKSGASSIELEDMTAERDKLQVLLSSLKARLNRRSNAIQQMNNKIREQSEIIDDVDAVIDGLRSQMGGE